MKSLVLAAVAALALSGTAHASIIPVLDSVTPDGSDFKFSYDGQLSGDQGVKDGSQLVIVDFAGYVTGSAHASVPDITATISSTLPAGMLLPSGVTDNPSIPDLIFTYTGPDFHTSGGPFPNFTNFNLLSADSTFSGMATGHFSAVAVKNEDGLAGTLTFNTGDVRVPGAITAAVPEPASWALMILGFLGLGTALRLGRSRSAGVAA